MMTVYGEEHHRKNYYNMQIVKMSIYKVYLERLCTQNRVHFLVINSMFKFLM